MKRFLSILVAVAMTISMVLPVFAYTDVADSDYAAAIAHLSGLGVVNGYEDGSYQPAKVVTRAEMAKLLVVALGLDAGADILTGESEFADVAANHWAIGYINVATQYGLIKGDGDGNFRPDDTVNYAEVVTMALRALNYTTVVEKAGQWPTNYLNKANELKLFEDVADIKASEGAKRGEVAQILWNMVNTEMWEVVSENEGTGLNSTANRTMLQVKFPDFNTKSTTTPVVYSPNFVKGKIASIAVDEDNDIIITIGSTAIHYEDVTEVPLSLVGSVAEVEALYTVNKDDQKIGASLFIDESLVVTGVITKEDDASDKVWIDGVEYKTESTLNFAGFEKFDIVSADIDKDSEKVEAVRVAPTTGNVIMIKEVKTNTDGDITYVTESGYDSNVVVDADAEVIFVDAFDGTVIADADVKAGMFIDADTSITGKVFVKVSKANLTGKVEKVFTNDGVLTIDGVEYKVATDVEIKYEGRDKHEDLTTNGMNSLVQQTISFKLNVAGEIAYIEASDALIVDNYAFVTKTWSEKVEGVDVYKVRLMDLNGNVKDYETYNFKSGYKKSEALDGIVIGDFIKFELKDGKVVIADEETVYTYKLTTDTSITEGKVYSEKVGEEYKVKAPTANPQAEGLYEVDEAKVEYKKLTASDIMTNSINKTSKTFVVDAATDYTLAYNSTTKFVEYIVKAADYKVEMGSFKAEDLVDNKDYIIIYDETSNIAEYVLYLNNGTTLAEKVYGVVVEADAIIGTENNSSVYATTVYDIATGETKQLTTGDKANFAKGDVVEYSEKADGKFDITSATKVGTASASTFVPATDIVELDANKEINLDGTKVLVTEDVKVIFVDASTKDVLENKTLEDISTSDDVYGAAKLEKVGVNDAAVYTAIVVVVK